MWIEMIYIISSRVGNDDKLYNFCSKYTGMYLLFWIILVRLFQKTGFDSSEKTMIVKLFDFQTTTMYLKQHSGNNGNGKK